MFDATEDFDAVDAGTLSDDEVREFLRDDDAHDALDDEFRSFEMLDATASDDEPDDERWQGWNEDGWEDR